MGKSGFRCLVRISREERLSTPHFTTLAISKPFDAYHTLGVYADDGKAVVLRVLALYHRLHRPVMDAVALAVVTCVVMPLDDSHHVSVLLQQLHHFISVAHTDAFLHV